MMVLMTVNLKCPRCFGVLLYDDGVGYCASCSRYWTLVHNVLVEATAHENLNEKEKARQLAEDVADVVNSHRGL